MSIKLNELSDNLDATKPRKRIGRGIGSGKGKTSGFGHKGQKARKGVSIKGFEGGQMPIYRRLPKRGFKPVNGKDVYFELTFNKLNALVQSGKIAKSDLINIELLKEKKLAKSNCCGISLIATGALNDPFNLEVVRASANAEERLVKIGGSLKRLAE